MGYRYTSGLVMHTLGLQVYCTILYHYHTITYRAILYSCSYGLVITTLSLQVSVPRRFNYSTCEVSASRNHTVDSFWDPKPQIWALLGCSGALVSRLSNWPYGASYGILCRLTREIPSRLTKSTDHPSRTLCQPPPKLTLKTPQIPSHRG